MDLQLDVDGEGSAPRRRLRFDLTRNTLQASTSADIASEISLHADVAQGRVRFKQLPRGPADQGDSLCLTMVSEGSAPG